ncbi:MAG: retroviral-like aspartic protease family protein [Telluria sp.]
MNSPFRLLFRALACTALLCALPAHAEEPDPKRCLYVNVASVPVHYTGPGLQVTMEGSLNGTPATLLVDTGAGDTALTRTGTEARGMSLMMTGRSAMGVGGYSRVYRTRFKEFRAGPAAASRGELRVLHDFGTPPAFDGIVGAPFLLQSDLEISLAEKEVRFFRPKNCSERFLAYWDPNATVIPFERNFSRSPNPQFTVLLNGKKLNAIIDSGASSTVVTLGAAKRAGLKLDAPGVERLGDAVGVGEARVARWATVFDTLQLGAETIRNAEVGVIDTDLNGIDLLLGNDFLRSHRVLFAMSQEKLYISYVGGEPLGQRRKLEPWLQQEADAGNTDAQMVLAAMYRSGNGVARDQAQAKTWFDRAAAGGNPRANFSVGRGLMLRADYSAAARHLRLALDKLPGDRLGALMLHLTRLHLGEREEARRDLEKAFAPDDKDQWPNPVARYFLGKIDVEELLEEARDDKPRARFQTCFAKTMMAEHHAALGDAEKAKSILAQRPECGPAPAPSKAT